MHDKIKHPYLNVKMLNESKSIEELQAELSAAEQQFGASSLEVSYKLDELATAYKNSEHLLDAANTSARAKSIRAAIYGKDAQRQEEKIGPLKQSNSLTATRALKILYRAALVGSIAILIAAIFMPSGSLGSFLAREAVGSVAAATLVQLSLFPIKSMPRFLKYITVAIISGVIWSLLSGGEKL